MKKETLGENNYLSTYNTCVFAWAMYYAADAFQEEEKGSGKILAMLSVSLAVSHLNMGKLKLLQLFRNNENPVLVLCTYVYADGGVRNERDRIKENTSCIHTAYI